MAVSRRVCGALAAAFPGQYIIDEPFPLLLTNDCLADHSALFEHVVRRLENPLEVGRIALGERKLLTQAIEADSPGEHVASSGHFDEAIQTSSHG